MLLKQWLWGQTVASHPPGVHATTFYTEYWVSSVLIEKVVSAQGHTAQHGAWTRTIAFFSFLFLGAGVVYLKFKFSLLGVRITLKIIIVRLQVLWNH